MQALAERGLVVLDATSGEVSAAPPAVALGALLRERHDELRAAELDLVGLVDDYRARVTDRAAGDLVEVITDVSAVRHRFAQIQQAARHEFRSMVVPNLQVVPAAANEAADAGIRRGVRYRSIVDQAVLAEPGGAAEMARSLAAGEEIRVVDRIPVKLVIADHDRGHGAAVLGPQHRAGVRPHPGQRPARRAGGVLRRHLDPGVPGLVGPVGEFPSRPPPTAWTRPIASC